MARSQETFNKKEREKQKEKARKQKEERKKERQENAGKGKKLEDMMAWLDENGNLSSTPPDPNKKFTVRAEDIEVGVPKQKPIDPADLIRTGVVTFFDESKGYGFIRDLKDQQSIFVHINSCRDQITKNSKVSFEIEMGHKGANAVNVKLI
jgi:cold shock CspA family protein